MDAAAPACRVCTRLKVRSLQRGGSRQQFDIESTDQHGKQAKTDRGNANAGQQGERETKAREQERNRKEHRQGRHHLPEGVPGMIGDLCLQLSIDMKPDQCEQRDQGQRGDEPAEPVAALCPSDTRTTTAAVGKYPAINRPTVFCSVGISAYRAAAPGSMRCSSASRNGAARCKRPRRRPPVQRQR